VLLDRDELAHWSLGAAGTQTWRVAVRGDALDLVVWPGEPAEAMAALTAVTGRHRVAPEWAMQPTLSRATLVAQDTAETYAEKVRDDLEQLDRRGLPVGCYAFEGWEVLPSEQVRETVQRLKAAGRHALLYLRSFVSDDTALTEPPARFGEALERRVVATGEDGEPYLFPSSFGGQSAVVDFTAGHARDWWTGRVQALMATGAEGFMCDFGEQVVVQMRFADGTSGERAHNAYPRWQHAATRAAAPEAFVYVRAGYSGRPGSTAYESATFPGDESNDWTSATGLPSIVPDMLNRAVGGAYGFTTDIGGYADFALDPQTQRLQETDAELFLRWSQAAVFTPFFRVHNGCLTGLKLPWSYDDDTERLWAEAARLHVRAVPLIRRLWAEAVQTGMPPTRPLWLVDDAAGRGPHADSQWLLGEDVVVAPVLERGATSRAAWLPPGSWQWQGSGPEVAGGREVVVDAPVDTLPWWTRSGTSPLAPEDAG
jgi:alpha-D-xyloside xylohydrolase